LRNILSRAFPFSTNLFAVRFAYSDFTCYTLRLQISSQLYAQEDCSFFYRQNAYEGLKDEGLRVLRPAIAVSPNAAAAFSVKAISDTRNLLFSIFYFALPVIERFRQQIVNRK
jgi:hypothetical protein